MTCYDESTLRAWLDDQPSLQAGVTLADISDHVASCADCQHTTADLLARSSVAASAIAALGGPAATDQSIEARLSEVRRPRAAADNVTAIEPRRRRSFAKPASAVAAAAVVMAVVGTPAGRTAAAGFLEQFRSSKITVVEIGAGDQAALAELAKLGEVIGSHADFEPQPVESIVAASERVGFDIKTPDPATIPAGVSKQGKVLVSRAQQLRFKFDLDRTRAYLAEKGSDVVVPDKFRHASLVVDVPAAAVQHFAAPDGTPAVVIGQARQLTASTKGDVTLEEFREVLLSIPDLSEGTRRQIENIDDWRETLPLPLPAGAVDWEETTIAGTEGLLLGDNTGLLSAAVWQKDGFIHGVAVRGKADQVKDVAAGLR